VTPAPYCLSLLSIADDCRILHRFAEAGETSYLAVVSEKEGSVATSKEIEAGLKAITEDFNLPGGGQMMLSRLVQDHLCWFDVVEARGLTVDDMVRLLFARGVKRKDGRAFSTGTLSSTLWRKRAEAERRAFDSYPKSDQNAAELQERADAFLASQSQGRRVTASPKLWSAPTKKALRPKRLESQRADIKPAQSNKASISEAGFSSNDRNSLVDARTSMKRAAAIRRKAD
jgi:hypothetical protein